MEIKEKILDSAQELFMRYGIKSITMDDIARHLSISKKTIYQYFKDKDEIVYLTAERHFEKDRQEMEERCLNATDAVDEMMRISICLREKTASINPSVLYDLKKHYSQAWNVFLKYKENYIIRTIEKILKRGIDEGLFRSELNVEIVTILRFEMVQLVFEGQVFPPDKYSPGEVQAQLFDHFLHGILSQKGLEHLKYYQNTETHK